jgi:hypothetical protein
MKPGLIAAEREEYKRLLGTKAHVESVIVEAKGLELLGFKDPMLWRVFYRAGSMFP